MRRQQGFTLIEIILATTLFSLLMSTYYVVFMRVVELEDVARSERSFGTLGPAVLDLIEDDLMSLYTHPRALDAYPFRGDDNSMGSEQADRMNFVATRASVRQVDFWSKGVWLRSPINEVGYRLATPGSRSTSVRRLYRRESFYVDDTPMDGGDYYEIYDRVVAFNLDFVGYRVEEEERTDQDTLGERTLEVFENWDSEQRRHVPTAVIVTLTVEPPQLSAIDKDAEIEPERRTFVRIIHLIQADDILPQQGNAPGQPTNPNSQNPPGNPGTTPPR